jgi:Flp pilus assembly pilin Flp
VEYGLIAAGLSLAIAALLQGIGARIAMNSAGVQVSMR